MPRGRPFVCITVAVLLAVLSVALVAGLAHKGVGHDKAEEVRAELVHLVHAVLKGPAVGIVLPDHADQAVQPFGDDQGIRHDVHRREVYDDDIKDLFIMLQQGVHALGTQQFGGVGRDVAGWENIPVFELTGLAQAAVLTAQPGDQIGEAGGALQFELGGHRGQAHVGIDEQDTLAGLGEGIREVDRGGALALAADRTGHADDVAVLLRHGEGKIRTQELIGLGGGKAEVFTELVLLDTRLAGSFLCPGHQAALPFLSDAP